MNNIKPDTTLTSHFQDILYELGYIELDNFHERTKDWEKTSKLAERKMKK